MNWNVELYKKENGDCPVLDFILSLTAKEQAKIEREIDLLEEFGIKLPSPHVKKLEGKEFHGLWELRIKLSSNCFRIFYFLYHKNNFILLHGMRKKSSKTSKKDLMISKFRMEDYCRRNKK